LIKAVAKTNVLGELLDIRASGERLAPLQEAVLGVEARAWRIGVFHEPRLLVKDDVFILSAFSDVRNRFVTWRANEWNTYRVLGNLEEMFIEHGYGHTSRACASPGIERLLHTNRYAQKSS